MQDNAVVLLKKNKIVKIKNFTDPKFSIDGRVIGFLSNNGENYIYCEEIKLTCFPYEKNQDSNLSHHL